MKFELKNTDQSARRGTMTFDRGKVETPAFMPVGTYGTVKAMTPEEVQGIGAQIILGNTFHLAITPGVQVIEAHGDLHDFMHWQGPILTDSGGFQVFSLGAMRKISEQGVDFRSPKDGSKIFMGPEESMKIQQQLGSDIVMIFDECTPYPADKATADQSMQLSLRWARRSKDHHDKLNNKNALFGIVQGGMYEDLRSESAAALIEIGFDGFAIGGLSVGEPKEEMIKVLDYLPDQLPSDKPRYLMGVGTPSDLVEAVDRGIDMFDCVMPTRNARNGMLFTSEGTINIKNSKWKNDFTVIDESGTSYIDSAYTKAYLHHLFKNNEILGKQIATLHNIRFYLWLMEEARNQLRKDTFSNWKNRITKKLDKRI